MRCATIPEQSRNFCVKPVSIANLNREFVRIREPCEEWNKTVQKLVTILKSRFIEEGELEDKWDRASRQGYPSSSETR